VRIPNRSGVFNSREYRRVEAVRPRGEVAGRITASFRETGILWRTPAHAVAITTGKLKLTLKFLGYRFFYAAEILRSASLFWDTIRL